MDSTWMVDHGVPVVKANRETGRQPRRTALLGAALDGTQLSDEDAGEDQDPAKGRARTE